MPETQAGAVAARYHTKLHEQFETLDQQHHAATLGMWVFLATEILFFGGVIMAYTMYRALYPDAFGEASRHLDIVSGMAMTLVLIGSSLTMAMGVNSAQTGARRRLILFLLVTILLGIAFLTLKGNEYYHKWAEHEIPGLGFVWKGPYAPQTQLFTVFYFTLTGLHALHMIAGIGILTVLVIMAVRGRYHSYTIEITGLYWHFVDIVWIFLFPLLYLVNRR